MKLAEYIWIDGTKPSPLIRSKTRVLQDDEAPPMWGFDGSSTNQAEGESSDCVLKPVTVTNDPLRGGNNLLVLCEVYNTDMTPHKTNTRAKCALIAQEFEDQECWYGLEQEYTLIGKNNYPLGLDRKKVTQEHMKQGDYYCGNGTNRAFGRQIAEAHLFYCLQAGLKISGINAEVCPGQWEFQVGPCNPVEVGDHLWIARYLLERISERFEVEVSFSGKPLSGDWNGAGCHANFSTKQMRESYDACVAAAEALGNNTAEHIKNYGHGIESRLTGEHETCSHEEFKYGVSDRTASIRIPWQVARDQKGYIEDRRPNANCDPYVVTRLITKSVCGE
jgi:glutamine synthetase